MPLVGTITIESPRYVVRCCGMDVSRMEGAVPRVERIDRKGLGGVAFRRIGRKPEPFPVDITCDYLSLYLAHQNVAQMRSTIVGQVVNLWHFSGAKWDTLMCVDLEPLSVNQTPLVAGGLTPNAKAVAHLRAVLVDAAGYVQKEKGYSIL